MDLRHVPKTVVGGLSVAALSRAETADLMIAAVEAGRGEGRPLTLSSANGEVLSYCARSKDMAHLFQQMDLLSADGQPLVWASRAFCKCALPERVATTDLFHDVASRAERLGVSFYLFGASAEENARALVRVRAMYPRLRVVGASHGYLSGEVLRERVQHINALKPDILWVALGVPREQKFCAEFRDALSNVAVIKTSGGLFNFLSGTRKRAPMWMQMASLEWLYRLAQEPFRLFARYLTTSPHAVWLLLTRSR